MKKKLLALLLIIVVLCTGIYYYNKVQPPITAQIPIETADKVIDKDISSKLIPIPDVQPIPDTQPEPTQVDKYITNVSNIESTPVEKAPIKYNKVKEPVKQPIVNKVKDPTDDIESPYYIFKPIPGVVYKPIWFKEPQFI